jgi:hypothetical protein
VINKIDTISPNSQQKDIKILLKDGSIVDPWCCISAKNEKDVKNLL